MNPVEPATSPVAAKAIAEKIAEHQASLREAIARTDAALEGLRVQHRGLAAQLQAAAAQRERLALDLAEWEAAARMTGDAT